MNGSSDDTFIDVDVITDEALLCPKETMLL
jgi:hypothetical protein